MLFVNYRLLLLGYDEQYFVVGVKIVLRVGFESVLPMNYSAKESKTISIQKKKTQSKRISSLLGFS